MPHKKALRSVCTPFARWKLATVINLMIILETLEDAVTLALRPLRLYSWRQLADDIEALPLSAKTGVAHAIITVVVLFALESGEVRHRLADLFLLALVSYIVTYCLAVLAGKPARVRGPRAHWVGENVATHPVRK